MHIPAFPFSITDLAAVEPEIHHGVTGNASWHIMHRGDTRIRLVRYSANYLADHWCNKGHFIYCIEGSMITALQDGRRFTLNAGEVYTVGDNADAHRSFSESGCLLFIVD